jgi:hypothetical protein
MMQKTILALLFISVLGCSNNDASADVKALEDSVGVVTDADLAPADRLIWVSDFDTVKGEFFLRQQRTILPDSLTPNTVVENVNAAWENVVLRFDRVSHDTIYVSIPDSEFLGQQMGSAGAQAYMA